MISYFYRVTGIIGRWWRCESGPFRSSVWNSDSGQVIRLVEFEKLKRLEKVWAKVWSTEIGDVVLLEVEPRCTCPFSTLSLPFSLSTFYTLLTLLRSIANKYLLSLFILSKPNSSNFSDIGPVDWKSRRACQNWNALEVIGNHLVPEYRLDLTFLPTPLWFSLRFMGCCSRSHSPYQKSNLVGTELNEFQFISTGIDAKTQRYISPKTTSPVEANFMFHVFICTKISISLTGLTTTITKSNISCMCVPLSKYLFKPKASVN